MPEDTTPSGATVPRFEDILAEILQGEERGQTPDVPGYVQRFPQFAEPLLEFFRKRGGFARLAPHLAPGRAAAPAAPDQTLTARTRFAGYEVLEELGKGGMGVVYRARQLMAGQEVALKVVRADRLAELSEE